jgi:DNA-binding LacI/PurR family transcriptional regulator
MSRNYNLKDLSRMLNMSPSTVSKALNDYPSISQMTRERVKELAIRLNYMPDPAAISFKRKKSFNLGVIIPNLTDHFYTIAVSGIEEYAMSIGYKAIVSQHYEDVNREIEICEMMGRSRVDGLIVSITKNTTDIGHFRSLEERGIPVVYFVRRPSDSGTFNVTSNVYKGTLDAVNFLVAKGHTRIAHILGPAGLLATKERYNGYVDGLEKNGIPLDKSLLATSDLSEASTIDAVERLMRLKKLPTAIITFKDYVALDAMLYLKNLVKKIKHEVAFIGFGNLPLLKYLDSPPLASLEEQCTSIGSRAAELLMKRIGNPGVELTPESIQFDCKLRQLR